MKKNKDLKKMLTEFEKEFGHIKEWEIDRDERLRSQSKDAANINVKSGHTKKLGKQWGNVNCKHPNFIKAQKELIERNGQHQLTITDNSNGGNNTWEKRKDTNHMSMMVEKSKLVCSKPVICLSKDGKFIQEYPSINEASRCVGVSSVAISCCLKGIQKTSAGFVWKYKDEKLSN